MGITRNQFTGDQKDFKCNKTNALTVLREIAQNFPTEARDLTKIKVENELKKRSGTKSQLFVQTLNLGTTDVALFINGIYYDVDSIDVFTLLEVLKKEYKLVEGLHRLVNGEEDKLKKLIKLDISSDKQDFQIDIRDGAVLYINDIENDKMYRNWPSSLHDMLRPTYPGCCATFAAMSTIWCDLRPEQKGSTRYPQTGRVFLCTQSTGKDRNGVRRQQ